MHKIVTLGEILVEIMAVELDQGFLEPGRLVGPFASGAPAIFIDQVGRLGQPCGMIGCVGDDDFGRLNTRRLAADGVDVSAIEIHADRVTGSAFVAYHADGSRDFVYNMKHAACGHTRLTDPAMALLAGSDHFHVMGSSLFSAEIVAEMRRAVGIIKAKGGTVSFDPNIRKEFLDRPGMRDALRWMLENCDIFLPSGPELTLLTAAEDEAGAIAEIHALGIGEIVVKRGPEGASYHGAETIRAPGFRVEEIDPTGAGDCFGATFVTCRLRGMPVADALRCANASGARTVGVKGPMEGTSSFAELDAFIARAGAVA
jgi:sugar/nucleoside kinase (ribokinase family)